MLRLGISPDRWRRRLESLDSPAARRALWVGAALLVCASTLWFVRAYRSNPYPYWLTTIDFGLYYRSAEAVVQGRDPYAHAPCPCNLFYGTREVADPFAYPPFFAWLVAPLLGLGPVAARGVWTGLSAAAAVCALVLLLRGFGRRLPWPWVALIVGTFGVSSAGRVDLYHGQVNPLLLLLLVLGLWLEIHRRPGTAGVVLGVAIVIKPFLGVVAILSAWRRDWRTAIASVATSGALFVLSLVPLGLPLGRSVLQSWRETSRYYAYGAIAARPDNDALAGLLQRLFTANPFTVPWVDRAPFGRVLSLVLLASLAILFVRAVPRPERSSDRGSAAFPRLASEPLRLAEVGLLMTLAMSYGPLTERDHLLLLLPGLFGVLLVTHDRTLAGAATAAHWQVASAAAAVATAVVLSPVAVEIGLPDQARWHPISGARILLTAQTIVPFLATGLLVAAGFRAEQRAGAAGRGGGLPTPGHDSAARGLP